MAEPTKRRRTSAKPAAAKSAAIKSAPILSAPETPVEPAPALETAAPEPVVPEAVAPEAPAVSAEAPAAAEAVQATPAELFNLVETNRRNMNALVAAQRSVTEGYFALAQRQAEILREAVATARGILADGLSKDGATPVEYARTAITTALANMKELADLATKANSEAISIVNGRIKESLSEFRSLRGK